MNPEAKICVLVILISRQDQCLPNYQELKKAKLRCFFSRWRSLLSFSAETTMRGLVLGYATWGFSYANNQDSDSR